MLIALEGDKVSMLTHTYSHNHQADSHFICYLMTDMVICKLKEHDVVYDTHLLV